MNQPTTGERAKAWRAEGRCVVCGTPTDGGQMCPNHQWTTNQRNRERRRQRKTDGLCAICDEPRAGGSLCVKHAEENRGKSRFRRVPKRTRPRSLTLSPRAELVIDAEPMPDVPRPRTRAECGDERPCPWVGCRYNLYVDVMPSGSLKLNFPDLEPWEMADSCALDVADRDAEATLDAIGALMNVSRQRADQLTIMALERARGLCR